MNALLTPMLRATAQLDDPAMLAVLWRSVAWAAVGFLGVLALAVAVVHRLLDWHGWWAWAADLLGGVGTALLAFWLFLPVATAIGLMFVDRIAAAVERRFYPGLPPARGASLSAQAWDGLAVGLRVLALNLVALPLVLLLPGVGALLAWAIAGWAIGRGLFVAVAMRRMPRAEAEAVYRQQRGVVLAQGGLLALAGYVPLLNLLVPVLGTAAMVHVLDRAITPMAGAGGGLFPRRPVC